MNKLLNTIIALAITSMNVTAQDAQTSKSIALDDFNGTFTSKSISRTINLCHDPSIIIDTINSPKDSPKYYIYGSHLGHGYTTAAKNYQSWTTWAAYENETSSTAKSLFANVAGERVLYSDAYSTQAITKVKNYLGEEVDFPNFDAHGWQYKGNNVDGMQWAPDVIYNKVLKKWCMYMSLNGDYWCSSIVMFTSDNIQGPWVYQGPVVFSGFAGVWDHNSLEKTDDWKSTDLAIATGYTELPARYQVENWGDYFPNCIDPCVFYDEDGNLWMSYGSWSGGIFIIRLDNETGLRDYTYTFPLTGEGQAQTSDPYFGKKIAGGYYSSGEASYIQHIGNYYYLWITNGVLTTKGGYQMRVYRSEKPDGPYVDAWGNSARPGKWVFNYSANADADYGIKLFGNYKWDLMPYAEICQGHNSVTIDTEGRNLLVNHTRLTIGDERHEVRVHQLFLTQDGWIVASPYEFSGETITDNDIATKALYTTEQICGNYQLMIHPFRQDTDNDAYATPVNIQLNEDGSITGEYTGTWSCPENTSYIDITLNKVLGTTLTTTFHGVLTEQTIDYSTTKAICFTACGTEKATSQQASTGAAVTTSGLCIWGSKAETKAAIDYTLKNLDITITDGQTVNEAVDLPTDGKLGAVVTWVSSDNSIMTSNGIIKGAGKVTLTLVISKDGYAYTKDYTINVDENATVVKKYYPESTYDNTTSAWWVNFSKEDYTLKAGEEAQFEFYNYNGGATANYQNWSLYGANATHGVYDTEYFGIRNDNWDNTTWTNNGCSSDFNWDTFCTDMDGSLVNMTVTYSEEGVFNMTSIITTTNGTKYNYSYTKTIDTKPNSLVLFFVNEASYISGAALADAINTIKDNNDIDINQNIHKGIYDLSGKKYLTLPSAPGIYVINGKKYIK